MDILLAGGWLILIFMGLSLFKSPIDINLRAIGWFFTAVMGFVFSYHVWVEQQSFIQSFLAIIVGFLSIYISYLILNNSIDLRQTTIFITVSTFILLIVYSSPTIQNILIYNVASETQYILQLMGYETTLEQGSDGVYIVFKETAENLQTEIILACTGIGSMALFIGFITAIDSIKIKAKAILTIIAISTIYVLNLLRNVFIAGAYGDQWFHIYPNLIETTFGRSDEWVSFYIADKIIAQFLSVLFMVAFAIIILHIIGENNKLFKEINKIINNIKF